MYTPDPFRVDDPAALPKFIAGHALGSLVATSDGEFLANHIPMIWRATPEGPGVLHGHVAKANPLWRILPPDARVLVIFHGAAQYISPSLYPDVGLAQREILPTWNYSVVHAHGSIRFLDSRATALRNVSDLAREFEKTRYVPWSVNDADASFIEALLDRIVPFEIAISRFAGKFKASQQRPAAEREFVARSLRREGLRDAEVADLIRSPARDALE